MCLPRKPKLEELMAEPLQKIYNYTQIVSTPWEYDPGPTERQMTLSRLTGRPPEDFIP